MHSIRPYLFYIAFTQAFIAMIGSLYFSEVLRFPPCTLCWYQRIALYPLVAIIAAGIILKDKRLPFYVLPISISGLLIALYHNLLYYRVIAESIKPCTQGISCTTKQIEWLGIITIPLLSLTAFTVITACMVLTMKGKKV